MTEPLNRCGKAMLNVALLIGIGSIIACHRNSGIDIIDAPKLPDKVMNASDPAQMAMQARFNKQGLKVITIGQDYMITIPAKVLFANESPRVMWGSYGVLNDVACYLKQFRKVAIEITAFSNKCISADRDRALTLARARAVGNYLWSQGVDSRFIFTRGLGSDKPIVAFARKGDEYPNSRIEITFRDAVA